MKYINLFWEKIISKKSEYGISADKIRNVIYSSALFVLVCQSVYHIFQTEIQWVQVDKDTHYYVMCIYMLTVVLILRKAKVFNPISIGLGTVYAAIVSYYLISRHTVFGGPDWERVLIHRYIAYGFLLLVVIDVLRVRKFPKWGCNKVFFIVTALAFLSAIIIKRKYCEAFWCPMMAFWISPIEKDRWKKYAKYLMISIPCVSFFLLLNSVINAPHVYNGARYYGNMGNISTAGAISGIAALGVVYLMTSICRKEGKLSVKLIKLGYLIPVLILPVYMLFRIGDRASELGFCFWALLFVVFSFSSGKYGTQILFRFATICLIVVIGIFAFLKHYSSPEYLYEYQYDANEDYSLQRANYIIKVLYDPDYHLTSWDDIIPEEKQLLLALDAASSHRISGWIKGMQLVTFKGCDDIVIPVTADVTFYHIHNNFLHQFIMFGWIGGTLMNVWFVVYLIVAIKRTIKRDNYALFVLLLIGECIGFFGFDAVCWNYPLPMFLMLFMYPFLYRFEDDEEKIDAV